MIAFIDDHRGVFGVGPICRVLGIAPSTFHAFKAVERDPGLASDRARQDRLDMAAIKEAFDGSWVGCDAFQQGKRLTEDCSVISLNSVCVGLHCRQAAQQR